MTPAALLAAAAAVLLTYGAADVLSLRAARRRARPPRAARAVALLGRLGRGAGLRPPQTLAARIRAAGLELPVADVMAVKAGAAAAGFAAGAVLATRAPGRLGPVLLLAAPAAAFLAPDAWLRRRARSRGRAIEAELADVLDLLRVAVAAGLAPRRALAEVGRRHPGLLAGELRRAAHRAGLGVPAGAAIDGAPSSALPRRGSRRWRPRSRGPGATAPHSLPRSPPRRRRPVPAAPSARPRRPPARPRRSSSSSRCCWCRR